MSAHFIYLIRTREFKLQNEPTYKIGKTTQSPEDRMHGYPKGSEIYLFIRVNNCHVMEPRILDKFHEVFVFRSDFGKETFSGNVDDMCSVIYKEIDAEIFERRNKTINAIIIENIKIKEQKQVELQARLPDLLLGTFIAAEDNINTDDNIDTEQSFINESKEPRDPDVSGHMIKSLYEHLCDVTINKITATETVEDFTSYIKENKPSWYKPGTLMDKDILYNKYVEQYGEISKITFTKAFKNVLYNGEMRKPYKKGEPRITVVKVFRYEELQNLYES
jgi:hypothetical protein